MVASKQHAERDGRKIVSTSLLIPNSLDQCAFPLGASETCGERRFGIDRCNKARIDAIRIFMNKSPLPQRFFG